MTDISLIKVEGTHKTIDSTKKAVPKIVEAVDSMVASTLNILGYLPNTINEYVQYSLEKTRKKLHQKLNDVPAENIVKPPVHIAAPTLQGACYAADCDKLHDMFANLLASSMNIEKQHLAHPSFIEIIKQLSPLEAKILSTKDFIENDSFSMCTFRLQERSSIKHPLGNEFRPINTGIDLHKNIVIYDIEGSLPVLDLAQISSISDNLTRLHIITIQDRWFSDPSNYDRLLNFFNGYVVKQANLRDKELAFIPKIAEKTAFGKQFYQACIL